MRRSLLLIVPLAATACTESIPPQLPDASSGVPLLDAGSDAAGDAGGVADAGDAGPRDGGPRDGAPDAPDGGP